MTGLMDDLDPDLSQLLTRPVPAPAEHVLLRARQQLAGHTGPNHSRRTIIAAAASAVLIGAGGVAVASRLTGARSVEPGSTAVTDFMNRLADTVDAAGPGAGTWREAHYWYVASATRQGPGDPERSRKIWIGHDRSTRLSQGGKGRSLVNTDAPDSSTPSTFGVVGPGAGLVGWDDLWTLPTDPERLETLLRQGSAGAGNGPDAELYVVVFDMLRESPAPPKLRAALYRVVATIPGVRYVGPVTDSRDRAGVAIARDNGGTAERYVFDADDGRILEESTGTYTATYLTAKPVQQLPG